VSVWVLLMIVRTQGVPLDVAEQSAIYVTVFDSYTKCASQANASNDTQGSKYLFECKEERVH
jgi:hypothetical protein